MLLPFTASLAVVVVGGRSGRKVAVVEVFLPSAASFLAPASSFPSLLLPPPVPRVAAPPQGPPDPQKDQQREEEGVRRRVPDQDLPSCGDLDPPVVFGFFVFGFFFFFSDLSPSRPLFLSLSRERNSPNLSLISYQLASYIEEPDTRNDFGYSCRNAKHPHPKTSTSVERSTNRPAATTAKAPTNKPLRMRSL